MGTWFIGLVERTMRDKTKMISSFLYIILNKLFNI